MQLVDGSFSFFEPPIFAGHIPGKVHIFVETGHHDRFRLQRNIQTHAWQRSDTYENSKFQVTTNDPQAKAHNQGPVDYKTSFIGIYNWC
jgi:hypothetical protein